MKAQATYVVEAEKKHSVKFMQEGTTAVLSDAGEASTTPDSVLGGIYIPNWISRPGGKTIKKVQVTVEVIE